MQQKIPGQLEIALVTKCGYTERIWMHTNTKRGQNYGPKCAEILQIKIIKWFDIDICLKIVISDIQGVKI